MFEEEPFDEGVTFPSFPTSAAPPTLSAQELAIVGTLPDAYLAHFLTALTGREWAGDDYLVVFMAYRLGEIPSNCLFLYVNSVMVNWFLRNMLINVRVNM